MKIGLRIPGTAQQMPFEQFCRWCRENRFDGIDVGPVTDAVCGALAAAGLEIGTADLPGLAGLFGTDAEAEEAARAAAAAIDAGAARGAKRFFTLLLPSDPARGRAASFARLRETFGPVVAHAEQKGVILSIEGWPGPGPHYGALCATPETWRALLEAFPSPAIGVNYDPSHLIRLGVDYVRFLQEFGPRVVHVHGKDTVFDSEALYVHGNLGPSFGDPKPFGEDWWRYCIPGEGTADWAKICALLDTFGYQGFISVELEDFRYFRTWEGESEGLVRARQHLSRYV